MLALAADAMVNGLIVVLFIGVALMALYAVRGVASMGQHEVNSGSPRVVRSSREIMWTVGAAGLLLAVFVFAR